MNFRSPAGAVDSADVILVNMPFGGAFTPALGLSILSHQLKKQGIKHQTIYYSLSLANIIGAPYYRLISEFYPDRSLLLGEWIFSQALFGPSEPPECFRSLTFDTEKKYVNNYINYPDISPKSLIQEAIRVGHFADEFIENCAEDILLREPKIVALASMFQQNTASLALAKRLKARNPKLVTVMGGANCEGPMGAALCETFPFLDYVVSGPGEISFINLCLTILGNNRSTLGIPGIRSLRSKAIPFASAQELPLDDMADPGFDDFFVQLDSFPELKKIIQSPSVLLETSRGCWWGQKHHCTFCGLNGDEMRFRYKTAAVAFQEIKSLERKYPGSKIATVDNIIPMEYFKSLLPSLQESPAKSPIFYETKANLKKDQLRQLARAGVNETQPGIESFSNRVLSIMNKGTNWVVNVQYLKWAQQVGITPYWNILYGFPGERSDDYDFTLKVIPLLTHIKPPVGIGRIRLDRFSPNYERAKELGFSNVRPIDSYMYVYRGIDPELIGGMAYFFAADYSDEMEFELYESKLHTACDDWRAKNKHAALGFIKGSDGGGILVDTRGATKASINLSEYESAILRELDEVTTPEKIVSKFGIESLPVIDRFICLGISLSDEGKLLGLANFFFEDGLLPSEDLLSLISNKGLTVTPLFGE